jgi:NYN domain
MELTEHVDQIVLFSGDGDFCRLVEAVQRRPDCAIHRSQIFLPLYELAADH